MLDVITDWAKNICLAVILISILEMLLPNNKTKKYVKMVMGIYLLFNIISPIITNKEAFSLSDFDINNYVGNETLQTSSAEVNQDSMDKRIQEIYIDELEKDIKSKLENKGYKVNSCKVKAEFENYEEGNISEIILQVEQNKENLETANENSNTEEQNSNTLEAKMIEEIQKIKEVEIGSKDSEDQSKEKETNLTMTDLQEIKKFLIEEYGVSEKCLKIN